MKKINWFAAFAISCFACSVGCMNGGGSNQGEPVVTTPSAAPSAGSAASSGGAATNSSLSIADSSYNLDTMQIDTIRK